MVSDMKFDPNTGFFHLPETAPASAVSITQAAHTALLEGQAEGKIIVPGPSGAPELSDPVLLPPTLEDARQERDRRIADGTSVNVSDVGFIPITGRAADRDNLAGLGLIALARLAAADDTPLRFRDAANVLHSLTPAQVMELIAGGAAYIEALHDVVWQWADQGTVPADFTDPGYWPNEET